MYTSIKMFAATLHDYAQAMLDDQCADARFHAAQLRRNADLMLIDPAFLKLYRERHPDADPEIALNTVAELLEEMVEYCRRLSAKRCNPVSDCGS